MEVFVSDVDHCSCLILQNGSNPEIQKTGKSIPLKMAMHILFQKITYFYFFNLVFAAEVDPAAWCVVLVLRVPSLCVIVTDENKVQTLSKPSPATLFKWLFIVK